MQKQFLLSSMDIINFPDDVKMFVFADLVGFKRKARDA